MKSRKTQRRVAAYVSVARSGITKLWNCFQKLEVLNVGQSMVTHIPQQQLVLTQCYSIANAIFVVGSKDIFHSEYLGMCSFETGQFSTIRNFWYAFFLFGEVGHIQNITAKLWPLEISNENQQHRQFQSIGSLCFNRKPLRVKGTLQKSYVVIRSHYNCFPNRVICILYMAACP